MGLNTYHSNFRITFRFRRESMNPPHLAEHSTVTQSEPDGEQPHLGLANQWIRVGGNKVAIKAQQVHAGHAHDHPKEHDRIADRM